MCAIYEYKFCVLSDLPKLTRPALTAGMFTAVAYPACARWNCPCSGYPKRQFRSSRSVDVQLLKHTTESTLLQADQLLKTLVSLLDAVIKMLPVNYE